MSHPIAMNLQLAIFRSDLRPPAGNRKLYLSIIFIFVNNCYQKKLVATKILYIKQRLPLQKTNPQTTPLIDTTSSTNAPKSDKFEQIWGVLGHWTNLSKLNMDKFRFDHFHRKSWYLKPGWTSIFQKVVVTSFAAIMIYRIPLVLEWI